MSLTHGQSLLHYRISDKLGEGGMGEVYLARDTTLDREVAIKVLPAAFATDDTRLGRFQREARLLASLNHPNIAAVYGLHEDGGHRFLAMELVTGENLAQKMERGRIPVNEAVAIAGQIAEALAAAHDRGVVHRDLKPANIMVNADGTVKVLDFGLAKIAEPEAGDTGTDASMSPTITSLGTQVGMILGTAAYMSPEQARGQSVDERADIWAMGVTIFEMLSGTRPFMGETVSDTLAAVLRADLDFDDLHADTPASVCRVLRRCLDRDPKRRLRDAGEVRFAVEDAGTAGDSTGTAPPAASRSPIPPALMAILVLGALLAGAGATAWLMPAPAPERRVVRAALQPPDGSRYFLTTRQPGPAALSPDGKKMAFVALDADRNVLLWVRSLAADTATPLAGTDGASYPFWSPDGRSLGFFADRKLKRIPAAGGAVLILCDAPFGKGGSWNQRGEILVAPTYNSEIHVVDADGGTPMPVTHFKPDTLANSHRFPWFLPDGRRFLYLARGDEGRVVTSQIRVGNLDGTDEATLLETRAQAQLAAGHLLYMNDQVLMARRFDTTNLTFTGEPAALAMDVTIIGGAARAVFSAADDGTLIYMRGDERGYQKMAWFDRTGRPLGSLDDTAPLHEVAISPDGQSLATAIDRHLWVFDTERGVRHRVTFGDKRSIGPIWMPDGKTLLYRSRGEKSMDIYKKAADGSGDPVLVLANDRDDAPTHVHPDGDVLLFRNVGTDGSFTLFTLPLTQGGEPSLWLDGPYNVEEGRFSPDGRWVAYRSDETGTDEIFVTSFPDKKFKLQVSTTGGLAPRWNEDGTELFFLSPRDAVWSTTVQASPVGIQTGVPAKLFDLTVPAYENYDVSDGRFLVETEGTGQDRPPLHLVLNWPSLAE
jgi:Tol biopolymer transport system component/tRNA A-37 threonylcarbamoyl transferase component Bud32